MNKIVFLASLLAATIVSTGVYAQVTRGNGNVVSQDRSVGSFNAISTSGSFDLVVTDGSSHKVTVEAEDNLQEFVVVETEGNTLKIRNKKFSNFRATKSITIHVTAPDLEAIRLSGSGNVKSENRLDGSQKFEVRSSGSGNIQLELETTQLSAHISGSGNITLKGKAKEMEGSISGSGNIRARELQSDITSVKISGSGSAEVVANEKLDSKIAGSGDVKFWGNGSVNSKVAGSGSVRREK